MRKVEGVQVQQQKLKGQKLLQMMMRVKEWAKMMKPQQLPQAGQILEEQGTAEEGCCTAGGCTAEGCNAEGKGTAGGTGDGTAGTGYCWLGEQLVG